MILVSSLVLTNTQVVTFESSNPFSLKDIITNVDNLEKQTVFGVLTMPDNVKDKVPVVIGIAGSKGWG